ncbi:hypothetical protein JTB14_022965 [Gonioctena quinquepunctata]|nr:hypothetical protein JTB14_022965 [Gonioctena quinquepunctata]
MDDYKVEKLNSENYRYWSMRTQGILEVKNLWQAVDPGFRKAEKIGQCEIIIWQALSPNQVLTADIDSYDTRKEVWKN